MRFSSSKYREITDRKQVSGDFPGLQQYSLWTPISELHHTAYHSKLDAFQGEIMHTHDMADNWELNTIRGITLGVLER